MTVAHTKTTGADHCCVTAIQVSGDAAALVTVESPSGTAIWRKRFTAAFTASENFHGSPLLGASGQNIQVKISASTANCEANIQGYDV